MAAAPKAIIVKSDSLQMRPIRLLAVSRDACDIARDSSLARDRPAASQRPFEVSPPAHLAASHSDLRWVADLEPPPPPPLPLSPPFAAALLIAPNQFQLEDVFSGCCFGLCLDIPPRRPLNGGSEKKIGLLECWLGLALKLYYFASSRLAELACQPLPN